MIRMKMLMKLETGGDYDGDDRDVDNNDEH